MYIDSFTDLWVDAPFEGYETFRAQTGPAFTQLIGGLLSRYTNPGDTILEVGAGDGALRRYAAHTADHLEWIETDFYPGFTEDSGPRAERRISRLPHINAADESQHALISLHALDTLSLKDLQATAEEAARALRPGGVLIHIMDLTPEYGAEVMNSLAEGKISLEVLAEDHRHRSDPAQPTRVHVPIEHARRDLVNGYAQPEHGDIIAAVNDPTVLFNTRSARGSLADMAMQTPRWQAREVNANTHFTARLKDAFTPHGFTVLYDDQAKETVLMDLMQYRNQARGQSIVRYQTHEDLMPASAAEATLTVHAHVFVAQKPLQD